jgi:hypothetical protein
VQQAGIAIPNPDTIQEFRIQTTLYDAGYGRDAGANVDVVTKSGSNQFHGGLFEFFRNTDLDANDSFLKGNGQSRPIMQQNQFGGIFGGPLRKNKLFFFGSYQGTRQVNGLSPSSFSSNTLPALTNDRTAAAVGKLFCGQPTAFGGATVNCDGSNINPVALNLLNVKIPNGTFLIPTPRSFTPGVLGRLDPLPSLAAEDADESPHRVRLPASGFHDFGKCGALGALHHRDHFRLLVGAIRLWLGDGLLGSARLLRGLGFLGGFARAFGLRRIGRRLADALAIDCVLAH